MKQTPLVSVIIPSLNQGRFIKETLDSIISQEYPHIEVIIIDGGSTDETLKIIKKCNKKNNVTWVSEKDKGQADAINKGLGMAIGDIAAYINSDDYYLPHTISRVVRIFQENPHTQWVTGGYKIINEYGKGIHAPIKLYKTLLRKLKIPLSFTNSIIQPSTFWKRSVHSAIGFFDSELHFAFDYDFWFRLMKLAQPKVISEEFSAFRIHKASKGGKEYQLQFLEDYEVVSRYEKNPLVLQLHNIHNALIARVYHYIK